MQESWTFSKKVVFPSLRTFCLLSRGLWNYVELRAELLIKRTYNLGGSDFGHAVPSWNRMALAERSKGTPSTYVVPLQFLLSTNSNGI